jgi:hypothetical protein
MIFLDIINLLSIWDAPFCYSGKVMLMKDGVLGKVMED